MNERLFRERRHMRWLDARVGCLGGYRLAFTRAGGRYAGMSAPANILEGAGEAVYGVLYLLPLRKFARLDNSEGKQYEYLWTDVQDADGNDVFAVTYKVACAAPEGRPSRAYLDLVQEAARERGLPADYISMLDQVQARE
ncbi:MAG: gamma-glutamylcyclotransferase [Pseudomonadota bacterium]|nr:gamma-glutamylcyclotransferase [Pseudomonadota bacterium]